MIKNKKGFTIYLLFVGILLALFWNIMGETYEISSFARMQRKAFQNAGINQAKDKD